MCLCARGGGGTLDKVSKHGIHPNPDKVQGISDLRLPKEVYGNFF